MAFFQERTERECLTRRPIDPFAGLDRLGTLFQKTLHRPVNGSLRNGRDLLADVAQRDVDTGIAAARIVNLTRRLQARPAAIEPVGFVGL